MDKPLWMWAGFFAVVIVMLAFDLGLLRRSGRETTISQSLQLTTIYILVSLCFGVGVWHVLGPQEGKDFFTGYIIEKSLSVDNLFVISLVFGHFYIPRRYQQRVLLWGILGAIVLRGLMIGLGVILLREVEWVLYLFSAFLIFSGVKIFFAGKDEGEKSLKDNKMLLWLERRIPVTQSLHEDKFRVTETENSGKQVRKWTSLLLALIFIELADIVFAVDSVPAVFAVTTNPFIVYSSNIFAILGLRALYFSLSVVLARFAYMNYALALVLIFIGGKIFMAPFTEPISSSMSLIVTFLLLLGGVLLSLYKTRKPAA